MHTGAQGWVWGLGMKREGGGDGQGQSVTKEKLTVIHVVINFAMLG